MRSFSTLLAILVLYTNVAEAQLKAFPTAEGAGKFVTGGRGSVSTAPTVYEVTNLTDVNTAGSFRYACTNGSAARIVVFRVSGTIHLTSALTLKANTTIAGQTAPGEGICIADKPVILGGNNIIVRYMRFRLGDKYQNLGMVNGSGDDDAFGDNGNGRQKIIIDHCTAGWSDDEAFTIYSGDSVTVQWCMITEPLNYSYHFESGDTDFEQHAYGGIWGGRHATFHHNLIAHIKGRGPRFDGIRNITGDSADFRNNVIYNWMDYNTNGGEGGAYNIVNNYYKYGPSTTNSATAGVNRRNMLINPYKQASGPAIPYGKYYLTGNYCDNSAAVTANNWSGAAMNGGSLADTTQSKVLTPFNAVPIPTETALEAYVSVLAGAGCVLPNRDTLDQRIVNDVKNRTGKLIDVQGGYPHGTPYASTVDAWPALASGTAQTDTDHDGMPDNWETARGLLPANAADRNGYITANGYNNLENYINGDSIVAVGSSNICLTSKTINTSNTGQWQHSRDSLYSLYNTAVYTSALDSNHFVASILDNANIGKFNVSYYTTNALRNDGAGHYYLNRNITINPTNPELIVAPVTVRLYISKAEFDALKAADPLLVTIADLRVLKAPNNSCVTSLTGTPTGITPVSSAVFGTYANGYYVEFQTSTFSTFFFASSSFPIPVKLSSFNVKKEGSNTARINWTTAQEINSKNFEVQRSTGNSGWNTIATVTAAGNSNIEKTYSTSDIENKKGIYFYRLLQNDLDGRSSVSETRKLEFGKDGLLVQLYPNPANQLLNVQLSGADQFELILFDMSGRQLFNTSIKSNSYQLNTAALSSGMYTMKLISNKETINTKFIIDHH